MDGNLPSLPQDLVDAAAGFGDGLTGGLTSYIRNMMGTNGEVNPCGDIYHVAELIGENWPTNRGKQGYNVFKNMAGPRNGHLAGDVHPKTGVPFDHDGYPDFSNYKITEVTINQTGTRYGDFAAANREAGYARTPEGYTWHHHQDGTTMQLVPTDIHAQTGHTGGYNGR